MHEKLKRKPREKKNVFSCRRKFLFIKSSSKTSSWFSFVHLYIIFFGGANRLCVAAMAITSTELNCPIDDEGYLRFITFTVHHTSAKEKNQETCHAPLFSPTTTISSSLAALCVCFCVDVDYDQEHSKSTSYVWCVLKEIFFSFSLLSGTLLMTLYECVYFFAIRKEKHFLGTNE